MTYSKTKLRMIYTQKTETTSNLGYYHYAYKYHSMDALHGKCK